jgi:hypothetical protein
MIYRQLFFRGSGMGLSEDARNDLERDLRNLMRNNTQMTTHIERACPTLVLRSVPERE